MRISDWSSDVCSSDLRFAVSPSGDGLAVRSLGAFGDTGAKGALRVVESVWGDPDNDRLLLAEEDESYANEFKVYDLQGRFTGRTFGADFLQAQAEGTAPQACPDGSGNRKSVVAGTGVAIRVDRVCPRIIIKKKHQLETELIN